MIRELVTVLEWLASTKTPPTEVAKALFRLRMIVKALDVHPPKHEND